MARVRSPAYPALSLPDAITRIEAVHKAQQSTPEPRAVVIQHMGYSGTSGRSLKAISALIKYGLLEDTGSDGLRVTERALAIIYPDPENPELKHTALLEAARSPALFGDIFERWDTRPSETSLQAFLVREGFNSNSFGHVTRAFYETFDLVSNLATPYDSDDQPPVGDDQDGREDSAVEQRLQKKQPTPQQPARPSVSQDINSTKPLFDFETVAINTRIDNQEDLAELIQRLQQIKTMLPNKTQH